MHAQPLTGIRVLDFSAVVSGPMATGMLADQGAEVIKIEAFGGDLCRRVGPAMGDISALFATINRGKRSVCIDLKQTGAQPLLRQLVESADVLVENFRPGAMARLGLGYDEVRHWNPRLVYTSITGFGADGPQAQQRTYDSVIQAVSGMAAAHPHPDTGEPQLLPTLMCDKITALTAAQAITAALLQRAGSGLGQQVQVSMLDASLAFLWPEAMYNHTLLNSQAKPHPEFGAQQRLWRCADGWIAMMFPQDDEFAALCHALGLPGLVTDARFATMNARRDHTPLLRALLEPVMTKEPARALAQRLAQAGVPAGVVNSRADVALDPQVLHSQSLLTSDTDAQVGAVRTPAAAARFGAAARKPHAPAPHLGEHTQAVLAELGLSSDAVNGLYTARMLR